MRALVLTFLFLPLACAAAGEVPAGRDAQANCEAFPTMERGVVSCEEIGDQCAYSADPVTGKTATTKVGSPDAHWLCTCGGHTSQVRLYWCEDLTQ